MAYARIAAWLVDRAKRLSGAAGGNVTMTFALAVVPIVGFVGAAIDYSRANSVKAAMQAASNSTALMLSKYVQDMSADQITEKASEYFTALFNRPETTNVAVTPTFTSPQPGSFKLQTHGHRRGPDHLHQGGRAGQPQRQRQLRGAVGHPQARSRARARQYRLDVVEQQDDEPEDRRARTCSTTLKNAAKTDGDVKIAIIPFDTTVNLGTSYKNNDWFDYDSLDCNGSQSGKRLQQQQLEGPWEGCVRDRTYPFDAQDDPPTGANTKTYFPVHDCGSLAKLMPLTYDWAALNSKIDEMTPNGNTNVTIGLAWAWHALTTQAPLSEAAAPSPDLDKVIILLTDGENTESWKNSNNTKITSSSAIDDRTELVCTNIKAAASGSTRSA